MLVDEPLGGIEGGRILDELRVPVVAADERGAIVYCNPAAERLLRWPPGGLLGRPVVTLVPERFQHAHRSGFRRYLRTSQPRLIGRPRAVPARRADGTEVEVELDLTVLRTAEDRPVFVASLRDISDRVELRRQQAIIRYLAAATEVAVRLGLSGEGPGDDAASRLVLETLGQRLGWEAGCLWTEEDGTGELVCTETWLAPGRAPSAAGYLAHLASHSRLPVGSGLAGRVWQEGDAGWEADLAESGLPEAGLAAAEGLHAALAFPILSGRRPLGVVELFSTEVRDPDPELLEVVSAVGRQLGQLLERRRAEEASRFRAALLASATQATVDGVVALSPEGEVLFWNRQLLDVVGVDEDAVRRRRGDELLERLLPGVVDRTGFRDLVRQAARCPLESVRAEVHLADGRVLDCNSSPLRGEGGALLGRAWHFREITEHIAAANRFATLARTLQASLLPPLPPDVPGMEVATRYRPARASSAAGMEVGGDFYDLFPTRGTSWGFAIGDVCGKGVEAATLTALARYTIRAAAMRVRRPSQVLDVLNDAVLRDEVQTRFLTVATGFLRARPSGVEVFFASGGHPLPLVVRADGRLEQAGRCGLIIGAFRRPEVHDTRVRLDPGDAFVMFTDGVTEARGPAGMLDDEGLRLVLAAGPGTAEGLADRVIDAVVEVSGGEPRDDVAVVVFRVPPAGPPGPPGA